MLYVEPAPSAASAGAAATDSFLAGAWDDMLVKPRLCVLLLLLLLLLVVVVRKARAARGARKPACCLLSSAEAAHEPIGKGGPVSPGSCQRATHAADGASGDTQRTSSTHKALVSTAHTLLACPRL